MTMFNCLLDGFPEEFEGYPLNTDYRVGVLITLLLDDDEVDEKLKLIQAFDLLYAEKVPEDPKLAIRGLLWFLSCGKSEICYADGYVDEKSVEQCLDFNLDHLDIWGAFWAKGVDLNEVNMHWFKFMSALSNLGDCPITQKISYRATDLSKMKGETRKYYSELKNKYRVRKIVTRDEMEAILQEAEAKHGSYYAKLLRAQQR